MNFNLHRVSQTLLKYNKYDQFTRTLVSQASQCQEAWDARLKSPIFQKIKLGEYFVELDRKFGAEFRGSALDVDIFAQAVATPSECEQLEELLFKLRRTPHTTHTPPSTSHATIRAFLAACEHQEGTDQLHHLVKMLDDRINYGLFLDDYTTVLLLDQMLEKGKLVEGARIASHIMLQEEQLDGPGCKLGNLACWRYCASGRDQAWYADDEVPVDENPDEVIRVRVPGMVPNNYEDDHFDLREPNQILGKTLWYLNREQDNLSKSLSTLGLVMWGKDKDVLFSDQFIIVEDIRKQILEFTANDQIKAFIEGLDSVELDVDKELLKRCVGSLAAQEKQLVDQQTKHYLDWSAWRDSELEKEYEKLTRRSRMEAIQQTKQELAREQEKLFFFDNFDKLEMEKEEKLQTWKKTFPRRNWSQKDYYNKGKYLKKPGQERKEARWEKREAKKGPAK